MAQQPDGALGVDPEGPSFREGRDGGAAKAALDGVRKAAKAGQNLMPPLVAAVRARATLGEIVEGLKGVFGVYEETPEF